MRFFFVLFLFTVVSARQIGEIPPTEYNREAERDQFVENEGFQTGKQYRFVYDGQLSTGIPTNSAQFAITRIQAIVLVTFNTDSRMLFKMTHIGMGKMNQIVHDFHPMILFQAFEKTNIAEELEKLLQLPVLCRYQNGVISDLVFDGQEQPWSANIKRGVLNMFQMKLKQNEPESDRISNENGNSFFVTREITLEGDCETVYSVVKDEQNKINVTKTINFDKCDRKPEIRYNFRFAGQCSDCEKEQEKLLTTSTVSRFTIFGSFDSFIIEKVDVDSQYSFAPLSKKTETIDTFVKKTLVLVESGPIRTKITEPVNQKVAESGLIFSLEWDIMKERFFMLGDDTMLINSSPYLQFGNKVKFVQQIVGRLIDYLEQPMGINAETPMQMSRLVEMLRMCTGRELDDIRRHVQVDERFHKKVDDLLIHALATAGTRNTIVHLVELIKTTDVHPVKAALALKSLTNTAIVSEQQIDLLFNLCQHRVCKKSPLLEQSCYLTIGSMIYGLCGDNGDKIADREKRCPRQLKQRYIDDLLSLVLSPSSTKYRRILGLKTLGNAGLDLSLLSLEPIIVDQMEHPLVRGQAIEAVRLLTDRMPAKIVKMLMPVFINEQEQFPVRMSAVVQIFRTLPNVAVLGQIVDQITVETNNEMAVFVFSLIKLMGNATIPCKTQLLQNLHTLIKNKLVDQQVANSTLSNFVHLPYYSDDFDMGGFVNMDAIFNNDSNLPIKTMTSLGMFMPGQLYENFVQLGIVQMGGEHLITKILSKKGFSIGEEHENILTRVQRNWLKDLRKKIGHGLEKADKVVVKEGEKTIEKGAKTTVEEGVKVVKEKVVPAIGKMAGKIINKGIESAMKKVPRQNDQYHKILAMTMFQQVECWTPMVSSGLKVIGSLQTDIPMDVNLSLDIPAMELKLNINVPQLSTHLLAVQTRPVSFTKTCDGIFTTFSEPEEKTLPINDWDQVTELDENLAEIGLPITMKSRWHKYMRGPGVIGVNNLQVDLTPCVETPEKVCQVQLEFDLQPKFVIRAEPFSGKYQFFDDTIPDEEVPLTNEDFEPATFISEWINDIQDEIDDSAMYHQDRFEGDIVNPGLTPDSVEAFVGGQSQQEPIDEAQDGEIGMNAIKFAFARWPNGRIPYTISSRFSSFSRNRIAAALKDYAQKTCLQFVPRTAQDVNYIRIFPDNGCYSLVGRNVNGDQPLSLGNGCVYKGIIIHELMHAVGFFHEQGRNDRDDYVRINWSNIQAGRAGQFDKYLLRQITHLGTLYDYNSIMHYGSKVFSKNGRDTIVALRKIGKLGQREGFSNTDLLKINRMYHCANRTTPVSPIVPTCKDLFTNCGFLAKSRYCTMGTTAKFFRIKCPKSCNKCQ